MNTQWSDGVSVRDMIYDVARILQAIINFQTGIIAGFAAIEADLLQIHTDILNDTSAISSAIATTNSELSTLTSNLATYNAALITLLTSINTSTSTLVTSFATLLSNNATYQAANATSFATIITDINAIAALQTTANASLSTLISNLSSYQSTNAGYFASMITDLLAINTSITTSNSILSGISTSVASTATNTAATNTALATTNSTLSTISSTLSASKTDLDAINTSNSAIQTSTASTATNTAATNTALATTNSTLSTISTTLSSSKTDLDSINTSNSAIQTNTTAINTTLGTTNSSLTTINTSIGGLNTLITATNSALATGNASLATINTSNTAIQSSTASTATNTGNTTTQLVSANTSLNTLITNTGSTVTDLASMITLLTNIYAETTLNRSLNDMIFTSILVPFFENSFANFVDYGINVTNDGSNTLTTGVNAISYTATALNQLSSQQTIWNGAGQTTEMRFGVKFSTSNGTGSTALRVGVGSVHNGFQVGFSNTNTSWGLYNFTGGRSITASFTVTTACTLSGNVLITLNGGLVSRSVPVTSTGATTSFTASQIANFGGLGGPSWAASLYLVDQVGPTVYFTSMFTGAAGGTVITVNPNSTGVVGTATVLSSGSTPSSSFTPFASFNVNPTYAGTLTITNWNNFSFRYAYNGNMIVYLCTYNNSQTVVLHQFTWNNITIIPHMTFLVDALTSDTIFISGYQFFYESLPFVPGQPRAMYAKDIVNVGSNTAFPIMCNYILNQKYGYRNYINTVLMEISSTLTTVTSGVDFLDALIQLFVFPTAIGSNIITDYPNFTQTQADGNSNITTLALATTLTFTVSSLPNGPTMYFQNYFINAGGAVQAKFQYGYFIAFPGLYWGVVARTAATTGAGTISVALECNEIY